MTEVSGVTHMTLIGDERIGGSMKCLPNVSTKILHLQTGSLLGPNEEGEIYVNSPGVMYH